MRTLFPRLEETFAVTIQHGENSVIPADVFVGAYCIRPGGNGNRNKGASIAPLRRRPFCT